MKCLKKHVFFDSLHDHAVILYINLRSKINEVVLRERERLIINKKDEQPEVT